MVNRDAYAAAQAPCHRSRNGQAPRRGDRAVKKQLDRKTAPLSVTFALLLLIGCDASLKEDFDEFCRANIPALPTEQIKVHGVEFRGDFSLYRTWSEFAEFAEFDTAEMPGDIRRGYSELRSGALPPGRYQMRLYEKWGEPCHEYFNAKRWREGATISSYQKELAASRDPRCQGISPIDKFESEYIVERIENPKYATIRGRNISALIYRVSVRKTGESIGEIRYFRLKRHPMTPDLPEFSTPTECGTEISHSTGYISDLLVFFEPRHRVMSSE